MKKGWLEKKLGEVCVVERGSSPRPIKNFVTEDDDGVNWVKIGDVNEADKFVRSTRQKITKEGAKKSRFVDVGDFILSNSMSFGRPYIMAIQGYIHDGWFVLRLPNDINSDYFWQLLTSPYLKNQFNDLAAGAIVKNISGDLVKKANIPIPPLSEQEEIVEVLDKAFAAIDQAKANIEQNIANAKELFQSKLNQIFSQKGEGWVETTLGEQVDLLPGYAFKSKNYTTETNGIPLLRGDNIMQGYLRWEDVKRWPKDDAEDYEKFKLRENDVVLAMDRPWVSAGLKVSSIRSEDLPCLQVQRTARLRSKGDILWGFLFNAIQSDKFIKYILGGQTGIGVPHISGKQILSFTFSLPSFDQQDLISKELDTLSESTNQLESHYQAKLASLDELKKSILQKAFAGELT